MPTLTESEWLAIRRECEDYKARAIGVPTFVIWFGFWVIAFVCACMLIHAGQYGPSLNTTTYYTFGALLLIGTILSAIMSVFYFYKNGLTRRRLPKPEKPKSMIELVDLKSQKTDVPRSILAPPVSSFGSTYGNVPFFNSSGLYSANPFV